MGVADLFCEKHCFTEVLGILAFLGRFLLIMALKRPILRGLERLLKSVKVKRVSALVALLAD